MTTSLSALRGAVNVKAHGGCPMCGQESWAGGEQLLAVPEMRLPGQVDGPPLEVLPFVCTHCGFVRLHAVQPLETIDD